MKNIVWLGILLTFTCLQLHAQEVKYIVPPENSYSRISNFSEGMAKVEMNGDTVGYVNTLGEMVFLGVYADAGNFHSGRAWVKKGIKEEEKYGFIDKTGQLVIYYAGFRTTF